MPLVVSLTYYLREIQGYYSGPGKVPEIQVLSTCMCSVFRPNSFFYSLKLELLENAFQGEDFFKTLLWCNHVCRKPLFSGLSLLFSDIFCVNCLFVRLHLQATAYRTLTRAYNANRPLAETHISFTG